MGDGVLKRRRAAPYVLYLMLRYCCGGTVTSPHGGCSALKTILASSIRLSQVRAGVHGAGGADAARPQGVADRLRVGLQVQLGRVAGSQDGAGIVNRLLIGLTQVRAVALYFVLAAYLGHTALALLCGAGHRHARTLPYRSALNRSSSASDTRICTVTCL